MGFRSYRFWGGAGTKYGSFAPGRGTRMADSWSLVEAGEGLGGCWLLGRLYLAVGCGYGAAG